MLKSQKPTDIANGKTGCEVRSCPECWIGTATAEQTIVATWSEDETDDG